MLHDPREFEWLAGHARNAYSQFGEDGVLETIFRVIGPENRTCFECGAADGLFFSNTRKLIEEGWNAVLVEADAAKFERLRRNNDKFGQRVQVAHGSVGPGLTIEAVLQKANAPHDLDLLVIDVDGQEFYLWNAMLRYRPRVVMVEFGPQADADFLPTLGGEGQAGGGAIRALGVGKYYEPVFQSETNLIFVRQTLSPLLSLTRQRGGV